MAEVKRLTAAEARQNSLDGTAILVCAYEGEELCRKNMVEGGMSLMDFNRQQPFLDKTKEVVFYCA